jgi:LAO/AO transport system kinase
MSSKDTAIQEAQKRIRSNRSDLPDIKIWAQYVTDGRRESLARAITLIESEKMSDRPQAQALLDEISINNSTQKNTVRIGVTGIPGVGKSTFIERLGLDLINEGHRVAVLAVDPSSQRTGGSILGDKTRMDELANNELAFVRPSPASDALGGVARATMEAVILCEAAGYDRVIVETVGVGQSETSVREMVDIFTLLLIGGAGDEVQGIKRGIVEMADLVVVNKADGENISACEDTASAYRSALHLFPMPKDGIPVTVFTASSTEGNGHKEVRKHFCELTMKWKDSGFWEAQREAQRVTRMKEHTKQLLLENQMSSNTATDIWNDLESKVKSGKLTSFSAAWTWVNGNREDR